MRRRRAGVLVLCGLAVPAALETQRQGVATTPSARDSAPIDLTGYWVSYVTENWRYRMVTPPKGEYRRIPVAPAAVPIINAWDPAADARAGDQCKSYGAGNIMSVPGRLHITWQDADTLRIDTDAGRQTRLFRFRLRQVGSLGDPTKQHSLAVREANRSGGQAPARTAPSGAPTWQGVSTAGWERATGPDGGGSLRVATSNLRAGYLRKNGVPYSERATMAEHFDLAPLPDGGRLLLITTVIEDPVYLRAPYVVSPHFKKEPDGSKWDPTPCSSTW